MPPENESKKLSSMFTKEGLELFEKAGLDVNELNLDMIHGALAIFSLIRENTKISQSSEPFIEEVLRPLELLLLATEDLLTFKEHSDEEPSRAALRAGSDYNLIQVKYILKEETLETT